MAKVTKSTVAALLSLVSEGEVRASSIKDLTLVTLLLTSGCIRKERLTRSTFKYVLLDEEGLRMCCGDYDVKMRNLEDCYDEFTRGNLHVTPSEEIQKHGEDHLRKRNLWKGFFIKTNKDHTVIYRGEDTLIRAGQGFLVENGKDIVIPHIEKYNLWVVENLECFLNLKWLSRFGYDQEDNIVICRWPQSARARKTYGRWEVKEKKYFGDYDLAGINIFQTEFAKILGNESFFIPASLPEDLVHGSKNQFSKQKERFNRIIPLTREIGKCLQLIVERQKGLSQEYYLL